jgi:hypothetical protein
MTNLEEGLLIGAEGLHLADREIDFYYALFGHVAANRLAWPNGDVLNVGYVGASGSGKNEMMAYFANLDFVRFLSSWTGASMLGGHLEEEVLPGGKVLKKVVKDGILADLEDKPGAMIFLIDATTMLSQGDDEVRRLTAQMRETTEGTYVRNLKIGKENVGLPCEAKIGIALNVTAAAVRRLGMGEMGTRFVFHRLPERTEADEMLAWDKMSEMVGREQTARDKRAAAGRSIIEGLDLTTEPREPSAREMKRLRRLSQFGAGFQSVVPRDEMRNIEALPEKDAWGRVGKYLRHHHRGLTLIGAPAESVWRILVNEALGGIEGARRTVLDAFCDRKTWFDMNALRRLTHLPETTVQRALDELVALGAIEPSAGDHPVTWGPTPVLKRIWWALDSEAPPSLTINTTEVDSDAAVAQILSIFSRLHR